MFFLYPSTSELGILDMITAVLHVLVGDTSNESTWN